MCSLIVVVVVVGGREHIVEVGLDAIVFALLHGYDGEELVARDVGEGAGVAVGNVVEVVVCPADAAGARRMGVVALGEVVVVVASGFAIASCPEAEVAEEDTDGDVEEAGIVGADGAVGGVVGIDIGGEVGDEVFGHVLHVVEGIVVGHCVLVGQDGLVEERHTAVVECELEVGPGTVGFDDGIFLFKHLVAALHEGRVGMCEEVVAILDDGVVVARVVVRIVGTCGEVGNGFEVELGMVGEGGEFAAQLAEQDGAVGYDLHLADDADERIDGIVGCAELVVFDECDEVGFGLAAAGE